MPNKRDPAVKKKFLEKKGHSRTPRGHEVDHIKPLEDGGRDSMANMQILTKAEHQKKTNRKARARAKKKEPPTKKALKGLR